MVKLYKGSGSEVGKPTCATCGKKHYGECLLGTGSYFGCGKDGQKVCDCHTRDGRQVTLNVPKDDTLKKRHFYALPTRGAKPDKSNDDDDKFLLVCSCIYLF